MTGIRACSGEQKPLARCINGLVADNLMSRVSVWYGREPPIQLETKRAKNASGFGLPVKCIDELGRAFSKHSQP